MCQKIVWRYASCYSSVFAKTKRYRCANTLEKRKKNVGSTLQIGMDRCIHIKRKLSPQNTATGNKTKLNRNNLSQRIETQEYTNRKTTKTTTPVN